MDAPILDKSKGKLKWIVLDEAHSIGSQAAELSLLLRRVLHGFGVDSNDVRFVATSATIGDPKGEAARSSESFWPDLLAWAWIVCTWFPATARCRIRRQAMPTIAMPRSKRLRR